MRRALSAVARRSASFTVSLIVVVPSSARAALRASSSRSTRCFPMDRVYTGEYLYIHPFWQFGDRLSAGGRSGILIGTRARGLLSAVEVEHRGRGCRQRCDARSDIAWDLKRMVGALNDQRRRAESACDLLEAIGIVIRVHTPATISERIPAPRRAVGLRTLRRVASARSRSRVGS